MSIMFRFFRFFLFIVLSCLHFWFSSLARLHLVVVPLWATAGVEPRQGPDFVACVLLSYVWWLGDLRSFSHGTGSASASASAAAVIGLAPSSFSHTAPPPLSFISCLSQICAVQMGKGLTGVSAEQMEKVVIAYEPVGVLFLRVCSLGNSVVGCEAIYATAVLRLHGSQLQFGLYPAR